MNYKYYLQNDENSKLRLTVSIFNKQQCSEKKLLFNQLQLFTRSAKSSTMKK